MNQQHPLDQIELINTFDAVSRGILLRLGEHQDAEIRYRAVEKVASLLRGTSPDTELIQFVNVRLMDPDELVRCASLEFLEDHIEVANIPQCVSMLQDVDAIVRAQAARVLGAIKSPAAVPAIRSAIETAEEFEKVSLHYALFQIEPTYGVEPFLNMLNSHDYRARCAAANLAPILKHSTYAEMAIKYLELSLTHDSSRASRLAKEEALSEMRE